MFGFLSLNMGERKFMKKLYTIGPRIAENNLKFCAIKMMKSALAILVRTEKSKIVGGFQNFSTQFLDSDK